MILIVGRRDRVRVRGEWISRIIGIGSVVRDIIFEWVGWFDG